MSAPTTIYTFEEFPFQSQLYRVEAELLLEVEAPESRTWWYPGTPGGVVGAVLRRLVSVDRQDEAGDVTLRPADWPEGLVAAIDQRVENFSHAEFARFEEA